MNKVNINKNTVYSLIIVFGIFLIFFYWASLYFNNLTKKKISEINVLKDKYEKVTTLYKKTKSNTLKKVDKSLLVFIQDSLSQLNLTNKIISLKPLNNTNASESVILRLENLNLNEIVNFIEQLDKYSNISFNKISQTRRFDNENLADLNIEISKLK